ncbi:prevent-host-death protein [Microseira sp. BLCC-F43]|uniref:prevent-host-death protein n=1 Tax=Microseira sp. BLCC-F43 TaxID=3153602 RepID=UPI0035B6ED91
MLKFLEIAQEEDVILLHEGKPVGYLVGFADEDDWIDYLMLHNEEFQTRLRRSLQDAREGRTIAFEKGKLVSESEN